MVILQGTLSLSGFCCWDSISNVKSNVESVCAIKLNWAKNGIRPISWHDSDEEKNNFENKIVFDLIFLLNCKTNSEYFQLMLSYQMICTDLQITIEIVNLEMAWVNKFCRFLGSAAEG